MVMEVAMYKNPLPCPFCNEFRELLHTGKYIKCTRCGACGPTGDELMAIGLWNRAKRDKYATKTIKEEAYENMD